METTAAAALLLIMMMMMMLLLLPATLAQHKMRDSNVGYNRPNVNGPVAGVGAHVKNTAADLTRQGMSEDIRRSMNLSADPCADFYAYACGNWWRQHNKQTRLLSPGELLTAQQLLETSIDEQLEQVLRTPPPPTPQQQQQPNRAANERKVIDFYHACLSANLVERRKFLNRIFMEHGGIGSQPNLKWQPNYDWLQMLTQLRRNYGLDILIGLDVDLNLQQLRGNSVYLGEPQLSIIPAEYCSSLVMRSSQLRDDVYAQLQDQVASHMRSWFGLQTAEAARFGGDIVRFEFELCKSMREDQTLRPAATEAPNKPLNYGARSRTGQDRLHQQTPGSALYPRKSLIELTRSLGNIVNFKQYVESIVEGSYTEYVFLRSQPYLAHLANTIQKSNRNTIFGYIMYIALRELNQPLGEHGTKERSRHCMLLMRKVLPQVMGEMYQRYVQRDDGQLDLEEIFNDVVKAFEQQLKVEWLDEQDRRAARSKLAQYRTLLPDYQAVDLNELHLRKSEDFWNQLQVVLGHNAKQQLNSLRGSDFSGQRAVDAFEVRAALAAKQQAVVVGWGLLQRPFYSYYYPRALRYALIGQRLAKALLQAFDDDGWNNTPLATAPWNELTMSGYRNASECYRAQYSNYLYDQPSEFRNASKLRDLIADGSALNVAFNAYLNWLERTDHRFKQELAKETLPNLNFSNTQLFFIYFAQTRCWARKDEQPAMECLPLAQHTAERWDINGPLSNSEEFGREFNCALGTHMNSDDKCLVY